MFYLKKIEKIIFLLDKFFLIKVNHKVKYSLKLPKRFDEHTHTYDKFYVEV